MYDWNSVGIILCDERSQTFFAEKAFWKSPIGVLQPFAVEYLGFNLGGLHSGGFEGMVVWITHKGPGPPPPLPTQTENVYIQSTDTYRASRTLASLVYVFSYIISGDK